MAIIARDKHQRRQMRVRARIRQIDSGRARLSVHRSNRHVYAQVIDDVRGVTLAAASSMDKELQGKLKATGNKEAAAVVGKLLGERAVKAGVSAVTFDRGGYLFHGRVKALADAAREAGLQF